MATRYIYLQDDLNNKLKSEPNVSALISQLLIEHYKITAFKTATTEDIELRLSEVEENRKKVLEQLKREESNLITKKELIKQQTEFYEKDKEVLAVREIEKVATIKKTFFEETGRDIKDEELDEYLNRFNRGEANFNIFRFIDEKLGYFHNPEEEADKVLKS